MAWTRISLALSLWTEANKNVKIEVLGFLIEVGDSKRQIEGDRVIDESKSETDRCIESQGDSFLFVWFLNVFVNY